MRERLTLGTIAAVTVLAGLLHYAGAGAVVSFVVAGTALGGLAWAIGSGTEIVGGYYGAAVTSVLQTTLGNLPELFVVLFALSAGEVVVAQTSILGSLFANALLVLGLAIVAGSIAAPDGVMRFRKRLANDTATLLLLAVFIIVLLGLSDTVGDRASQHSVEISASAPCACSSSTCCGSVVSPGASEPARGRRSPVLVWRDRLLAVAGLGAALVSDWFDALDPAVEALGLSKAFTGLVIVAIAGNAVENVVGVTLAAKGQADLAISVVKNSVAQIAVFLYPALVLLSLFFTERLTFVLSNPVYIGALLIMALAVWQITGDGQAVLFEGLALVAIYIILAVLTWYE
jgi:Ca2+:H+ antiporter